MNRIILIGNGFDLAHDMATSYLNFMDYFWEKTIKELQNSYNKEKFMDDNIIVESLPRKWKPGDQLVDLKNNLKEWNSSMTFKNRFLEKITERTHLKKWVDIENEYYLLLKEYLNPRKHKEFDVTKLNSDFEIIKNLLKNYLEEVEQKFHETQKEKSRNLIFNIGTKIYAPISYRDFTDKALNQLAETTLEAVKNNRRDINNLHYDNEKLIKRVGITNPLQNLKKILLSKSVKEYFDLIPKETLFLNFNYTSTEKSYTNAQEFDNSYDFHFTNTSTNHIHGTLDNKDNNPIIFGFGDEIDDDYKALEKLNNNEYLENIKSIKYLETANYRKLLEFINDDDFQVFIFGHSCGISDRTLLNTMFEHDNCKSIKVFYHQINENEDNYSDIIKNISRNFNDKALMRDKVVNKTFCEPLV